MFCCDNGCIRPFNEAAFVKNTVVLRKYLDKGGDVGRIVRYSDRGACQDGWFDADGCYVEDATDKERAFYYVSCIWIPALILQISFIVSGCGVIDQSRHGYTCDQEVPPETFQKLCCGMESAKVSDEHRKRYGLKWTLLHYAVYWKLSTSIKILIEHGANLGMKTTLGFTPLDIFLDSFSSEQSLGLDIGKSLVDTTNLDQVAKFAEFEKPFQEKKEHDENQEAIRKILEREKPVIEKWTNRRKILLAMISNRLQPHGNTAIRVEGDRRREDARDYVDMLFKQYDFENIVQVIKKDYSDLPGLPRDIQMDLDNNVEMGFEPECVKQYIKLERESERLKQAVPIAQVAERRKGPNQTSDMTREWEEDVVSGVNVVASTIASKVVSTLLS